MFLFLGLFVHAAVRGGTCAFTLKIVSTLIQKQLTRREASDLDIEASHGEPGSCRARPVNVDDGLEDMRWIPWSRGREVARGVLRSSPKPEKKTYFLPSERDRESLSPVFYTAAPKCVCIRRLAGARHVSPVVR